MLTTGFVAAAIALAAGCGGDGGGSGVEGGEPSASEWADDVCSTTTTWRESIRSAVDSLSDGELTEDELRSAFDDVESATNDFADDLRGLGTPRTEAGEEAKESLDVLADDIEESVMTIKGAVDDASGLSEIVAAATTVSATLSALYEQMSSTFAEVGELDPQGELQAAFSEADSCDELESGGP